MIDPEVMGYEIRSAEHIARAEALLPAWFVPRMMTDEWSFGMILSTGRTLCLQSIDNVRSGPGGVWIDATMMDDLNYWMENDPQGLRAIIAPTDRLMVSINAAHVVAVFEIADT